jgi:hypothetical protein
MDRLTGLEERTLASWNFIRDYHTHATDRQDYIELGWKLYKQVCREAQNQVELEHFVAIYTIAVLGSTPFQDAIQRKQSISADYESFFAGLLSRYILREDWRYIRTPYIP